MANTKTVLIVGPSKNGKSTSCRNIRDPENVLFLNLEAGKVLPFRSKFVDKTVTDPKMVPKYIDAMNLDKNKNFHTIVLDTITMMMDLYENLYIRKVDDKQAGWGNFQFFFKELMQVNVAASTKNIVMLAHTLPIYNDMQKVMETKVPIKGALKNTGIEAYFTVVVAAKKLPLEVLKEYKNDLLTFSPEEEALGVKYVFQTKYTEDTLTERISSPIDMWSAEETFIDNDVQLVLDRLTEYYQ